MVRLISYNIEYGEGNTEGTAHYLNPAKLLRASSGIAADIGDALNPYDPDIIGLVEVDAGSARTRHEDEAAIIAEKVGLDDVVEAKRYQGSGIQWLIRQVPYMSYLSNVVLSGLERDDYVIHRLDRGVKNVAIQITYTEPQPFTLLLVHLALGRRAREEQLDEIKELTRGIETPLIVCGDFNTFRDGELNHLLEETRLRDSHEGREDAFTHPTWDPQYKIDNVLVSPEISVDNYDVLDEAYSDHLPVLVDYSIESTP